MINSSIYKRVFFSFFFIILFLNGLLAKYYKTYPISLVPASFPVNFALFSAENKQYIAFYDTSMHMVIGSRNYNNTNWDFKKLDTKVWHDSHNYISMVIDSQGYIHIAGNMHSTPLIYFKSMQPFDIHSIKLDKMVGKEEDVTTYPEFMNGPNGELLFHYRYGRSGDGYEVYNIWNAKDHKWERLMDKPLLDGQGKMNAYMQGPVLGPDGYYHLIWVWRDTPDCATNHTLSYARSQDLLNWESIRGEKVYLPITIKFKELYVDTTQAYGGLINIGIKIGFDSANNPLIGYHKYDDEGYTQLYLSRYQNGNWHASQVSNWYYRWDFKGYGTIENELLIESPQFSKERDNIVFGFHHIKYGDGQIIINKNNLEAIGGSFIDVEYPLALDTLRTNKPGFIVNKVFDAGNPPNGKKYMLRWETAKPNRDKKREIDFEAYSVLELIEY